MSVQCGALYMFKFTHYILGSFDFVDFTVDLYMWNSDFILFITHLMK